MGLTEASGWRGQLAQALSGQGRGSLVVLPHTPRSSDILPVTPPISGHLHSPSPSHSHISHLSPCQGGLSLRLLRSAARHQPGMSQFGPGTCQQVHRTAPEEEHRQDWQVPLWTPAYVVCGCQHAPSLCLGRPHPPEMPTGPYYTAGGYDLHTPRPMRTGGSGN